MSEEKEKVQRVVRGGATMYPQESPRPPPVPFSEVLKEFLTCAVRGPALATLVTKLVHPYYQRWYQQHLARGGTDVSAFTWSMNSIHAVIYLSCFLFYELGGKTEWLHYYQLPRSKAQEPSTKMKLRTILEFAVSLLGSHFFALPAAYKLFRKLGMPEGSTPLPSALKMFAHFSFSYMFNRIMFGVVHRIFHHGPLYRAFHKKHHEYVGTISIAAENAHPIEALGANVGPTLGGALLAGAHPLVIYVWLAWRLEQTYEAHSGYCFHGTWLHKIGLTNSNSAAFHDFHHTENKGSFGCEFTDTLFGTMDRWIQVGRTEGYVRMAREQHEREKQLKGGSASS